MQNARRPERSTVLITWNDNRGEATVCVLKSFCNLGLFYQMDCLLSIVSQHTTNEKDNALFLRKRKANEWGSVLKVVFTVFSRRAEAAQFP